MKPIVGIIMGSDSDLPVMAEAETVLRQFGVPVETTVVSAHRTPDRLVSWAKAAQARGIKVVISGAGGAAHLPGMTAAMTPLPVIGVPIKTSSLNGMDSLFSIVQMPPGIPVATVAINGGKNAGLLALRILALQDSQILTKMEEFIRDQENSVLAKAEKMESLGGSAYLAAREGS